MLKNFNKNYRNNRNISIFTRISYHSVFTRPLFLLIQHNHKCDTLLPIVPCTRPLPAIAKQNLLDELYSKLNFCLKLKDGQSKALNNILDGNDVFSV